MTISDWHAKIRLAQAALDVALRGELPTTGETEQVAMIRGFIQDLDQIVFRGFDLLRPKVEPRQAKICTIKFEELEI